MMKSFFNTSEVAEMLDIPASTVRFWATKFDFRGLHKTAAGHRKFSADEVERMKQIYHLVKEKGLTIEGARQRLRGGAAEGVQHDQELMQRLLAVRSTLVEIREELKPSEGEVWRVEGGEWSANEDLGAESEISAGRQGAADNLASAPADAPAAPLSPPDAIEQTLF